MSSATSNTQLERLVLGAILQSEQAYWSVSEVLNATCFADEDHRAIWTAIHEQALLGRAIRVSIISSKLPELSQDQDPDAYLAAVLHAASEEDSIPLQDYALELRDLSTKRRLREIANGMLKAVAETASDPMLILDRASERLADLARDATSEHETTMAETARQIAMDAGSAKASPGMRPCLVGLERMLGTFMPGTLILWGASPGGGKTALAMQQALYTSAFHAVSVFELEMDARSIVARSIASQTGIPARQIMRGLTEQQIEDVMGVEKSWLNRRLKLVVPPQMTMAQLRSRALYHKRTYGMDMMIVDHIKLIRRPSKYRISDFERAYENAGELKALAKELNCCVIALCQFTKTARQKENPEPEMEDFYGGSLEEHADVMLANLNRSDWLERNPPRTNSGKAKERWDEDIRESQNRIEIYKLKDRFGSPRDRHFFHWDGVRTLLSDLDGAPMELFA